MSITTPTPEPSPEDVARGLAEIERYVAGRAPNLPVVEPAMPAPAPGPVETENEDGETRRVRQLRAEVAEARLLLDLQEDDAPLLLDTPRVRRRRRAAHEAARLHELAQDPTMRAWQASRMRRILVVGAMVSLALALGWSTAGVQEFAADGAPAWSPAWVFAWFVEPFVSLALLVVVGARAYLATRGRPLDDPKLVRIEWLFLLMSLGMNAWPYLPWSLADGETFSIADLVMHLIGPVVAVTVVTALPIVLAGFTSLDHGRRYGGTGAAYRANATGRYPSEYNAGPDVDALAARVRRLIEIGELPTEPGIHKIRKVLGCGTDTARDVAKAVRAGGAETGGAA
ncbi:hypothetical protein [Streptosporangium sandarakinum]|uniref:hypothetical protein n=1 Tax=Streptosporangium sandarakinum TaxID=1260955 RepID=UPI0033AC4511